MTIRVRELAGPAGELHAKDLAAAAWGLELWVLETTRPAMVLGSRQGVSIVDAEACRGAGVDVTTRRSGGGVVLVEPGAMTWVDVVVPADDRRWHADVTASMRWCGERWRRALAELGETDAEVAGRADAPTAISSLVCFGGIGQGEVIVNGAKLVGICQRRTRAGSRFQCSIHHDWRPAAYRPLLAADVRAAPGVLESLPVATISRRVGPALVAALATHVAT